MNKVFVLGIGPGSREYLPQITKDIAAGADVHIGGQRALELFAAHKKEQLQITADLERIREYIAQNYRQKKIAVLVSGDPGLYSLLNYLKQHFPSSLLEVVPGISSLQLAFARVTTTWQDAEIISLHGADNKEQLLHLVRNNRKVACLTGPDFPPASIASYLLREGVENRRGLVCTNLSYDSEQVVEAELADIANKEFGGLTVMVIYDAETGL